MRRPLSRARNRLKASHHGRESVNRGTVRPSRRREQATRSGMARMCQALSRFG